MTQGVSGGSTLNEMTDPNLNMCAVANDIWLERFMGLTLHSCNVGLKSTGVCQRSCCDVGVSLGNFRSACMLLLVQMVRHGLSQTTRTTRASFALMRVPNASVCMIVCE